MEILVIMIFAEGYFWLFFLDSYPYKQLKYSIDAGFSHIYYINMYKQKQVNTKELELFEKKVFEEVSETVTISTLNSEINENGNQF